MLQEKRLFLFFFLFFFVYVSTYARCSNLSLIYCVLRRFSAAMADSFTLPFRFIHPPGFSRTSSQTTPGHPREGCFSTTVPKFLFFLSPPIFLVAFIPHTSTHFSKRSKATSIVRVGNRLMLYENEMESSSHVQAYTIYTVIHRRVEQAVGELVPRSIYMIRTRLVDGEACHLLNV